MPESVDGLIDVAHAEEAPADQVDQAPLQGVGVLQLVHEDFVEPRGSGAAQPAMGLEKPHRVLFEIAEVERGIAALLFAINGIKSLQREAEEVVEPRVPLRNPIGFETRLQV